jgi:biotin transport system substrate-specific component
MTVNTQAPTLRLALLPRGGVLTDALLVCAGAGLIAASAQISVKLPFTPVPITGQTFSVLLVGASLGVFLGGASALLYVLLGLVFPVYAGHGEGWDVIVGASGGYLISYPFVAALTGYLAERRWDRTFSSAIGAMLTGTVVLNTNLEQTLEDGLYPFIPGDTFKLYLAAAALPAAWRLAGRRKA